MGTVVTSDLQVGNLKCRKVKECAQDPRASKWRGETHSASFVTALNLLIMCISYNSPMSKYYLLYPHYRMEKGA